MFLEEADGSKIPNPERTLVLAEIQKLRSLLKTYEIMGRKLESQCKLKDSEIMFLREKLKENTKQNKLTEKRLNQSVQVCNPLENLHLSGLNQTHFVAYLNHTVKSIRGFVKLMLEQMKLARWDLSMAANSIQPGVFYYKQDHKCFAFEHFVSNVIFDPARCVLLQARPQVFRFRTLCLQCNFRRFPSTTLLNRFKKLQETEQNIERSEIEKTEQEVKQSKTEREAFFERFTELRLMKAKDYLNTRPKSRFARFCRVRFLRLIHPKMEEALFGHTHLRNQVSAGVFPETSTKLVLWVS